MNVSSKFSKVTTKLKIKEKQNTAIWRKMTKNRIFTKTNSLFLFLQNIKEQIRQGRVILLYPSALFNLKYLINIKNLKKNINEFLLFWIYLPNKPPTLQIFFLKDSSGTTEFFRHGAVWVQRRLLVVLVHNLNAIFEKKILMFFF